YLGKHRSRAPCIRNIWQRLHAGQEKSLFVHPEHDRKIRHKGSGSEAPAKSLSGGNQQKVVLARELSRGGKIIVADQPSRGVDIGAIEFIHKQLIAMRDLGCGVFLISADLDEIFSLADRILVIFKGRIMGELSSAEATVEEVGRMMAGIVGDGEKKIG
ncbi:MAG TPA: hypothetical protein VN437_08575, partial [Rectinemataceae bacterium]|nr:hypothetical protein [Rectinemataceae bacterium]